MLNEEHMYVSQKKRTNTQYEPSSYILLNGVQCNTFRSPLNLCCFIYLFIDE